MDKQIATQNAVTALMVAIQAVLDFGPTSDAGLGAYKAAENALTTALDNGATGADLLAAAVAASQPQQ